MNLAHLADGDVDGFDLGPQLARAEPAGVLVARLDDRQQLRNSTNRMLSPSPKSSDCSNTAEEYNIATFFTAVLFEHRACGEQLEALTQ